MMKQIEHCIKCLEPVYCKELRSHPNKNYETYAHDIYTRNGGSIASFDKNEPMCVMTRMFDGIKSYVSDE